MQCAMQKELRFLLQDVCNFYVYYDDVLLLGSFERVRAGVQITLQSQLRVNISKSVLFPVQKLAYLGVNINAIMLTMTVLPNYLNLIQAAPVFFASSSGQFPLGAGRLHVLGSSVN